MRVDAGTTSGLWASVCGTDWRQHEGGQLRVQDRAARREVVGRRTGRCGDDDAVGPELRHGPAVELDREGRDTGQRLAVQDGVVQRPIDTVVRPSGDRDVEQAPAVLAEASRQDLVEAADRLLLGESGEEPEQPDVDPEQRRRRRSVARDREKGPVAAQDDDQVGLARHPAPRHTIRLAESLRGGVVEESLAAPAPDRRGEGSRQPNRGRRGGLGHDGDPREPRRRAA